MGSEVTDFAVGLNRSGQWRDMEIGTRFLYGLGAAPEPFRHGVQGLRFSIMRLRAEANVHKVTRLLLLPGQAGYRIDWLVFRTLPFPAPNASALQTFRNERGKGLVRAPHLSL
jgi:hypothetical protein